MIRSYLALPVLAALAGCGGGSGDAPVSMSAGGMQARSHIAPTAAPEVDPNLVDSTVQPKTDPNVL